MRDLYRWQRDSLEAWHDCGRRGVIEAVTGSGKTDVAINAIADAIERHLFALVIVPSRVLMEQWHDRLTTALPGRRVGRLGDGYRDRPVDCDVLITTRHSAASRVPLPTSDAGGLLVADECHGFGGAVLRKSLLPEYGERLGLTATLERSDDAVETILLPYFGGISFRYGFGAAIADGVCAEPRVAFLAVPLTEEERADYDASEGAIVAARRILRQIPGLPTSRFGDFLAAVNHLAENDGGPDGKAARDYLDAFSSRREIVATSSAKYQALGGFAGAIGQAEGALIFTETVRAANHAVVRLDPHVRIDLITGGTGRGDRGQILDGLREGTLDAVAAPRVLDEGVDVPNANLGIVVSASRTRRQMIQRMGRVLRRKPAGVGARFVIMFAADTIEDPRYRDGGDGFLDEIEEIAEASRVFRPGDDAEIADFLDYRGPAEVTEPTTVGSYTPPRLSAEELTARREAAASAAVQPTYLELQSPELPEVRQRKVVREKPRLSTGDNPVTVEAAGAEWVLRCTGCGATSPPRAFRWQALDDKVDCTCGR